MVRPTALQKRSGGTPGLVAAASSRCQTLSGGSCTILALHPSQSCCAWGVAKVARAPGIWEQRRSALPSPASPHHKPLWWGALQEAPWKVLWRRPLGRCTRPRRRRVALIDKSVTRHALVFISIRTSTIEYSTQICIEPVSPRPIPFPCRANFVHDRNQPKSGLKNPV